MNVFLREKKKKTGLFWKDLGNKAVNEQYSRPPGCIDNQATQATALAYYIYLTQHPHIQLKSRKACVGTSLCAVERCKYSSESE